MNSRRLRNESIKHQEREETLVDDAHYYLINTTDSEFYFILFVNENKIYNIKMTFPKTYPFRAPKVLVITEDGEEIGDYLVSLQNIKAVDKKNQRRCLCCESLVCHGRWHAVSNTIHIMDEINKNYNILNNNVIDACCKSIIRQRFSRNAHPFLEYKLLQQYLY